MKSSKNITDNDALLLYRVGPVLCCSPTHRVSSIVMPQSASKPPGVNELRPGVFKHVSGMVSMVDLRVAFGIELKSGITAGRIIVVDLESGRPGFLVDEIIDVIDYPKQGWGQLPALVPDDVFESVLMLEDKIRLYCDFDKLNDCRKTGYLSEFVCHVYDDGLVASDDADSGKQNDEKNIESHESVDDLPGPASEQINIKISQGQQKSGAAINKSFKREKVTAQKTASKNPEIKENYNTTGRQSRDDAKFEEAVKEKSIYSDLTKNDHESDASKEENISDYNRSERTDNFAKAADESRYINYENNFQKSGAEDGRQSPVQEDILENNNNWLLAAMMLAIALLLSMLVFFLFDADTAVKDQSGVSRPADFAQQRNINELDFSEDSHEAVKETSENDVIDTLAEGSVSISRDDEGLVIVIDQTDGLARVDEKTETLQVQGPMELPADTDLPATELIDGELKITTAEDTVSESILNETRPLGSVNTEPVQSVSANGSVTRQLIHVVVKGDTLWHIARRYIHNPYRYPELARLSNIKNPDLIYPGDRVRIVIIGRE